MASSDHLCDAIMEELELWYTSDCANGNSSYAIILLVVMPLVILVWVTVIQVVSSSNSSCTKVTMSLQDGALA